MPVAPPGSRLVGFLADLKRRGVGRVAVTYLAVAWLVVEVWATVQPMLGLPESLGRWIIILLGVGFPVAVALGWAFDIGPGGIERTESVGAATGRPAQASRAWIFVTAGAAMGAGLMWLIARPASAEGIRSVAVLPLANFVGSKAETYFVEGMHEELISELGKVAQLRVLSRTSVMRYANTDKSVPEIADELGVEGIIEGSVYASGDSVRITVQLIRAHPEQELWGESYDGATGEALGLHRRVARAIADEVKISLTPQERAGLADVVAVAPEAQESLLRGRYLVRDRSVENLRRGIDDFREAIRIQPDFPAAYWALADALVHLANYEFLGGQATPEERTEVRRQAGDAARHALELDPSLGEPHQVLGVLDVVARNESLARAEFARAIELSPNDFQAYNWLGELFLSKGEPDSAVVAFGRARALDPLHPVMNRDLARALWAAGRCDEAVKYARNAEELDPEHRWGREQLIMCAVKEGRFEDAADEMAGALAADGAPADFVKRFRAVYSDQGWEAAMGWVADRPRQDLAFLERDPAVRFPGFPLALRASVLVAIGRREEGLRALEVALERNELMLHQALSSDPWLDPVRDDPRFKEVVRRYDDER